MIRQRSVLAVCTTIVIIFRVTDFSKIVYISFSFRVIAIATCFSVRGDFCLEMNFCNFCFKIKQSTVNATIAFWKDCAKKFAKRDQQLWRQLMILLLWQCVCSFSLVNLQALCQKSDNCSPSAFPDLLLPATFSCSENQFSK